MISKYDWLKLRLQEGKVILIKSDFGMSVEKIILSLEQTFKYQEQIVMLSIFPEPINSRICSYRQILEEEEKEIFSLYLTYEFANNFRVLSRQACCGTFLNLVDAGVISFEEALAAWLQG